jgi:hypothetical protein
MSADYSFGADQGAFSLSGEDVTFTQGTVPVLSAAQGSFTLTGEDATLSTAAAGTLAMGSFALTGEAVGFGISMSAAEGSFAVTGEDATLSQAGTYSGIGDLGLATPASYYGMRAYNAAAIGVKSIVDIKRASDGTTQTFGATSDGTLDVASIATFLASTTGRIMKWYDQIGSNHLIPFTGLDGVPFAANPSGIGSGRVSAQFSDADGNYFMTTSGVTTTEPFFVSAVAQRTSGTTFVNLIGVAGAAPGLLFSNAADSMAIFGGSVPTFTVADGSFHAIGALFDNTSSQGFVNGAGQGAVSDGGAVWSNSTLLVGFFSAGVLDGDIAEIIVWNSDQSANAGAISANQRDATSGYGF